MIIATAGHIDHGKTLLVKELTGIDKDRLPEEKRRGMSVDLGFAYYGNDNETTLGFVDVPGHERFVRNMIAGVTNIDFALLSFQISGFSLSVFNFTNTFFNAEKSNPPPQQIIIIFYNF